MRKWHKFITLILFTQYFINTDKKISGIFQQSKFLILWNSIRKNSHNTLVLYGWFHYDIIKLIDQTIIKISWRSAQCAANGQRIKKENGSSVTIGLRKKTSHVRTDVERGNYHLRSDPLWGIEHGRFVQRSCTPLKDISKRSRTPLK